MASDREAAIDRLKYYEKLFTELMALVEGGSPGDVLSDKADARRRLMELKDALKTETKFLERKGDLMNPFERHFLEPALRQAHADINTSASTSPGPKWHSDLYGARIDITHILHQLEGVADNWRPAS